MSEPAGAPNGILSSSHFNPKSYALDGIYRGKVVGEMSLRDIVGLSMASVRLSNCVLNSDVFERVSLREFIRSRDELESEIRRTANFGVKSWNELVGLAKEAERGSIQIDEGGDGLGTLVVREDVRMRTLREVLERHSPSMRLWNSVLNSPYGDEVRIANYLDDFEDFRKFVLTFKSMGRTSFSELVELIVEDLSEPGVCTGEGILPGTNEAYLASEPKSAVTDAELGDWLLARLDELPERSVEIVERRYGLRGRKPESLEEIGLTMGVTRERIRQVEHKSIRFLRTVEGLRNAGRYLHVRRDTVWQVLSEGEDIVEDETLRGRKANVEPLVQLAVDVVGPGLFDWLSSWVRRSDSGSWIAPWVDMDEVSVIDETFPEVLSRIAFPCELDRFADLIEVGYRNPRSLQLAVALSEELALHERYVCRGKPKAVERRAIAIHRLTGTLDGSVFDLSEVARMYRTEYPEDDVAARIVQMALQAHPHLFGCLYDDLWYRLPVEELAVADITHLPGVALGELVEDTATVDGTIGSWIIDKLSKGGVMRARQLAEEARSDDHVLPSSIGPIILTSPRFERSASGVFKLREYEVQAGYGISPPAAYLSDYQCKLMAQALRSEWHWQLFPAWSDVLLYHACRWARDEGSREVYRSLLSVVDIETWEIDDEEKASWLREKDRSGGWRIEMTHQYSLGTGFPRVSDIFPCLLFLKVHGAIGWMGVARAAKVAFGHQVAFDSLAMLTAIGAVEAGTDRGRPHVAGPALDELFQELEVAILRGEDLSWDHGVGARMLARASSFDPDGTWIERRELDEMLRSRDRSSMGFSGRPVGASSEDDDL